MPDIFVAGHLCLDITPQMPLVPPQALTQAGKLFEVGTIRYTTGGMVANSGLVFHRLGESVGLVASLGDDITGDIILALLRQTAPHLVDTIRRVAGGNTSYSVVLSPAGQDRSFLHFTGTNETFSAADVDVGALAGGKIFHLGYPPLLPMLVAQDGAELLRLFQQVKAAGLLTSMDMVYPDLNSPAGGADWHSILRQVLPYVDVFVPSIDEIMLLLHREQYRAWGQAALAHVTLEYLRGFADELLAMGAGIVGFKLGHLGLYIRTTADLNRLNALAPLGISPHEWCNREHYAPAFAVEVVNTTGAGDACYAGLLTALLHGADPVTAVRMANGVAAYSIQAPDSNSGVPHWGGVEQSVTEGWALRPEQLIG